MWNIKLINNTRERGLDDPLLDFLEPFIREWSKGLTQNHVLLEPKKVLKMIPKSGTFFRFSMTPFFLESKDKRFHVLVW